MAGDGEGSITGWIGPESSLVTVSVGMDISLKQRSVAGGQWCVKTRPP